MKTQKTPISVITSDVHYNLNNLKIADAAMRLAITKANELDVRLIVAGDLTDNKANMRAEVVNAMLETFALARHYPVIIPGNHDRINEKGRAHALNFLASAGLFVIDGVDIKDNIVFIPYQHDLTYLRSILSSDELSLNPHSIVIMHQGLSGSNSGEYIQDHTAITPRDVSGLRIISGHYHTRQDIDLPNGGKWSYIGNPYTQNFGEANDPEKGFQILYDDGSLEFVPTKLRCHTVLKLEKALNSYWQITGSKAVEDVRKDDIIWVKAEGTREELTLVTKEFVKKIWPELYDFKLTLHPFPASPSTIPNNNSPQTPQLDILIDNLQNVSDTQKDRLKLLWKNL